MSPLTYCHQNDFDCSDVKGINWRCLKMALDQLKPDWREARDSPLFTEEICRDALELARRFERLLPFE